MATRSSALAATAITAALLLAPAAARAYCRTSSCPNVGTSQVCTPPGPGDCGTPLAWPTPCVGYSLQKDASTKVTFDVIQEVTRRAFKTWVNAACPGGGSPRMDVSESDPVECAKHEYNQDGGNANIVLFHDDMWPYEGSSNTLALTTVSYNVDNGEIYDADMELNSADANFTTGDANVDYDLLSILTHEAGHFLGLAHSQQSDATMLAAYKEHDTTLRTLSDDDEAGICEIYPPGDAVPDACDTTPRHGFSGQCGGQDVEGACCAVAPGSSAAPAGSASVLAVLGGIALAARRIRRKRARG